MERPETPTNEVEAFLEVCRPIPISTDDQAAFFSHTGTPLRLTGLYAPVIAHPSGNLAGEVLSVEAEGVGLRVTMRLNREAVDTLLKDGRAGYSIGGVLERPTGGE